jgi:RNA polymerase sigma factor (sigma-70 family)
LQDKNELPDAELLKRFAQARDEAAFELLVWRHGPMVLSVCRRLLHHEQDAEDAFQATFLALVRKADRIAKRESLGSWLYKVAYRVALRARAKGLSRARHEKPVENVFATQPAADPGWSDVRPVLDEEIVRLPERYQATFVLYYFDGKSVDEVSQELGCPPGTVMSRLAWARERLRSRLLRRGLAPAGAMVAFVCSGKLASPPVSAALVQTTVQASVTWTAGGAASLSAPVVQLAEAALGAAVLTKGTLALGAALAILALAAGTGVVYYRVPPPKPPAAVQPPPDLADQEDLSGTWLCQARGRNGKLVQLDPQDATQRLGLHIWSGVLAIGQAGKYTRLAFQLDPAQRPRHIDLVAEDPKGGRGLGIYQLEDDTLQICYAMNQRARPTAFSTRPGEPFELLIFKRAPLPFPEDM